MKLEFLSAYSSDFNSIELAFSLLKARLCHISAVFDGGEMRMFTQLYEKVMSISASDCYAFYHHCGYVV